jgi:diguanylate cyclase (GGDEF)-like protein/PAS domain S-box-containing protein
MPCQQKEAGDDHQARSSKKMAYRGAEIMSSILQALNSPVKILIVEDSLTQAQRLQHILEQQGYAVSVAANGRLALEMVPQFRPALIVSDVIMPEMDGYELSRRIKADADLRDIPVILVTTMSDPQDVIRGLECGADNFVLKPYDEPYLLARVQYVLVNREFRQKQETGMGVEIYFNDQRHFITADRLQILNLLLSTYDAAIQRNKELILSREALKKHSAEVLSAHRFLDSVIENIPNMVFVKDAADLRHVRLNRAGEDLLGCSRDELLGKSDYDFFPREEADFFTSKDRDVLARGLVEDIHEESIHTRDKGIRILHTKKVPVFDANGQPSYLLGISEDVTEQREMEREIRRLNAALEQRAVHLEASNEEKQAALNYVALFDVLTGLPNRQQFLERTAQSIQSNTQIHAKLALVVMDIRRFGVINDSFGKAGGDQVLKLVAERLNKSAPINCARIGGNTFAMALPDLHSDGDVAHALKKYVLAPLSQPFSIEEQELTITACCGVALFPADGTHTDELVGNAEAALKKAKRSGEEYLFYTSDLNARVTEKLALEYQLRRAITDKQFVLYYQPKVAADSGRLVGFEALIRWNSQERGLVPPFEFIPILEETGMILEVGKWVLQQAASDYRSWCKQGLNSPPIAVNISAIQLRQPDFLETVRDAVSGLADEDAAAIDLEITESVLMENIDRIIPSLQELKDTGFKISIDDFGTGYSSFGYLAKIPLNAIKIDRSFIVDLTTNPVQVTIVSTIILLAHALKLKVIAEGVETAEQLTQLQSMGCDELQGYLHGKPMPRTEVEMLLQRISANEFSSALELLIPDEHRRRLHSIVVDISDP